MKLFDIKAICFTGLMLGLAQVSATAFTLDAFSDTDDNEVLIGGVFPFAINGQQVGINTNIPLSNTDTDNGGTNPPSLNSVFSGQRTLTVNDLSSTGGEINLTVFNGVADLSTDSNTAGKAQIEWDGWEGSTTNFLDIEERNNGSPTQFSFQIEINSLILGNNSSENPVDIVFGFEIEDTSGNSARIAQTIINGVTSPQSFYFPYQDRVESTMDAGGDINLEEINYISFYTESENIGGDFNFNFIQSSDFIPGSKKVPFEFSPGLGLILGGGLFGFLKLRKRFSQ